MRTFKTVRTEDVSGVSGTGTVAEGVEFTDGTVAMRWLTDTASTALYGSIDDLLRVHGHDGATDVVWDIPKPQIISGLKKPYAINIYIDGEKVDA